LKVLSHVAVEGYHPNLIPLIDLCPIKKDFTDIYMVFEAMETDLRQILDKKEWTTLQTKFYISSILKGLSYLHSANILHRGLNLEF
jgi:serine/threonine protein kinase